MKDVTIYKLLKRLTVLYSTEGHSPSNKKPTCGVVPLESRGRRRILRNDKDTRYGVWSGGVFDIYYKQAHDDKACFEQCSKYYIYTTMLGKTAYIYVLQTLSKCFKGEPILRVTIVLSILVFWGVCNIMFLIRTRLNCATSGPHTPLIHSLW